jgi:hypothetical protein
VKKTEGIAGVISRLFKPEDAVLHKGRRERD